VKAYHALLTGDSGGGKTTLARELHADSPWTSIWINHNAERVPDGRSQADATTVRSARAVREAVQAGHTAINYRTTDVHAGVQTARSIGYYETSTPVQIVVDEAQEHLPESPDPENPIKRGLHQDRDMGIRYLLLTQDPSDLPYTPLKQMQYWTWVGPWSTFHDGFIRYFGLPREDLPTEPYQYAVMNKRAEVVYRGETDERFA